jgi:hypothetical protein
VGTKPLALPPITATARDTASVTAREPKRIWFRKEGPAPSNIPTPEDDARALLRFVAEAGYAGVYYIPAEISTYNPKTA